MKKTLNILAVIILFVLIGLCLSIGGFYNLRVKTVIKEVQVENPEYTSDLPEETEIPEFLIETSETQIYLGEFLIEKLFLTKLKNYLGVDLTREILVSALVIFTALEELAILYLIKHKTKKVKKNKKNKETDTTKALENYKISKDQMGIKF